MRTAIIDAAPLADSLHALVYLLCFRGRCVSEGRRPSCLTPADVYRVLQGWTDVGFQDLHALIRPPLFLWPVSVDPQVLSLSQLRRIEMDSVTYAHACFQHKLQQEPERLRLFRVAELPVIELQGGFKDAGHLRVRVRFRWIVGCADWAEPLYQRLCDPSAPIGVTQETTKLCDGRGAGCRREGS